MLFYDQTLNDIRQTQDEVRQLSNTALEALNASNIKSAISAQFDALSNELNSRIDSNLQNKKRELENQANNLKDNLNSQIQAQISKSANEHFNAATIERLIDKNALQQSAQTTFLNNNQNAIKSQVIAHAKNSLSNLDSEIKADIKKSINTKELQNQASNEIKASVRQSIEASDIVSEVKASAVQAIAQKYKSADFKIDAINQIADDFHKSAEFENLKQNISNQVSEFIQSTHNLEAALLNANEKIAPQVYENLLGREELMKMRLDTMLFLQALRLQGLDRSIIDIASGILSKTTTKKNILVVR